MWAVIQNTISKVLSARFILAVSAAYVLIKLTNTIAPLILTPELAKDILMMVGPLVSGIITFYFLRTDRGQDMPGTQETITKTTNTNTTEPIKSNGLATEPDKTS